MTQVLVTLPDCAADGLPAQIAIEGPLGAFLARYLYEAAVAQPQEGGRTIVVRLPESVRSDELPDVLDFDWLTGTMFVGLATENEERRLDEVRVIFPEGYQDELPARLIVNPVDAPSLAARIHVLSEYEANDAADERLTSSSLCLGLIA